jgi:hypothetical protein
MEHRYEQDLRCVIEETFQYVLIFLGQVAVRGPSNVAVEGDGRWCRAAFVDPKFVRQFLDQGAGIRLAGLRQTSNQCPALFTGSQEPIPQSRRQGTKGSWQCCKTCVG